MNQSTKTKIKRKAMIYTSECVACGSCVNVCPRDAISVIKGVFAAVDESLCVGCGKCKSICPAGIIKIKEIPA